MNWKKYVLFSGLMASSWAYGLASRDAVNAPNDQGFCWTPNPAAIERLTSLPQGTYAAWWPEFFSITSGGQNRLLASIMCSSSIHAVRGGGNCLVDLRTGAISPAPGLFDGVWVKDPTGEPIFTVPNKFESARGGVQPGLSFYRFSDVEQSGAAAPLLARDGSFGNHYHSFGLLERGTDSGGRGYALNRAMNDKWGVSIRDYRFLLDSQGRVESIRPEGPEYNLTNGPGDTERVRTGPVGQADSNSHHSYFDLPMISPDGRYFGANNRRTMTTQIFAIEPGGRRRLVADLGIETGKVSFAPRRTGFTDMLLAFHVDQIDPAEGDKMSGVAPGMTKDIVVMRLVRRLDSNGQEIFDPGQIVRVTSTRRLGDGSYYPKWINPEEFVFVESTDNNRQSFVKVNINWLRFQNNLVPRPGRPLNMREFAATAAMGLYITSQCTDHQGVGFSAREAALHSVNMDRAFCQRLGGVWPSIQARMLGSGELFQLRPPKAPGTQRVSGYNFHESNSARGAERFEQPLDPGVVGSMTAQDLMAVCDQLR